MSDAVPYAAGSAAQRILPQSVVRYPESIREWGCRFACLIGIPQLKLDLPLVEDEVLDIYQAARLDRLVMKDDAVDFCKMGPHEHKVISHSFRLLGHPEWRGAQVGELVDGRALWWAWVTVWEYHYVLAGWETAGGRGHWTVFDPQGRELYDPWDAKLAGYAIEKRRIRQRLLYRCWQVD